MKKCRFRHQHSARVVDNNDDSHFVTKDTSITASAIGQKSR